MDTQESYDIIVVGGGSAGCVVTRRMVDAGHRVLLLEAGPADDSMFVKMPATFVRVIGTERTWMYETVPQAHAANRTLHIPQGRTLGGGSSVNAMVYIRGHARDYDQWAAQGCAGWGWQDVLPWFRHAECNQLLSNDHHGADGLFKVGATRFHHPLSHAFIKGAQECGLPYNPDFNGPEQTGVGFYQTTTHEGERASTAASYLKEVLGRSNLTVRTGALARKVLFEGTRAQAVVWRDTQGGEHVTRARREIILTAGALATPKLLMLSGVGPAAHLGELGIPVVRDLPGVGENFQDHLEVGVYGRCREPISLAGNDRGLKALKHGLQWKLTRTGLLSSNVVESGGFVDTRGQGRPDIQFHVLPVLVGDVDRAPLPGHGLSINPCYLQPAARGQLRLASPDPDTPARLDGRFLSEQADVDTLVRGVRLARRILRAPSMRKLVSEELAPAAGAEPDDRALEDYVRARAKTVYHPVGTCRMGADADADAVVDTRLRVRGLEGLRICDASVMPTIVSGNTNAPVVMIAERCSDFLLS